MLVKDILKVQNGRLLLAETGERARTYSACVVKDGDVIYAGDRGRAAVLAEENEATLFSCNGGILDMVRDYSTDYEQ